MAKKLYVGNLPYSASTEELADAFSQFGAVDSVRIITDRDTGRSKGFAFVEMASDDDAVNAIEKMNGATYNGRALTVNEARPMERREGGGGGFGGGGNRGFRGDGGGGGGGGGRGGRGPRPY